MVDSNTVLNGQTIVYTCYSIVIILVMVWFGLRITKGKESKVSSKFFFIFVGFLTVVGVSLHIVTYNTIPWTPIDHHRASIKADKVFDITVENHKFVLPAEKMVVNVNDLVLFNVKSKDLTYGFGLFREDNTMLFQMQVVPGHNNDLLWQFLKPGVYSIRSTEYSGPKGISMIEKDVVEVI